MRQERLNSFSSNDPIFNQQEDDIEEQIHQQNEKAGDSSTYSFDSVFFKRFARLLGILFKSSRFHKPWSTKKEARKHSLFWLYITFITLGVSYEVLVYFVGMVPSQFYSILTSRDTIGFSKYILPCLLLVFSTATVSCWLDSISHPVLFTSFLVQKFTEFYGRSLCIEGKKVADDSPAKQVHQAQIHVYPCDESWKSR